MIIKKASPGLDQRNKLGAILGQDFTIRDYDGTIPLRDQVADAEVILIRDVPVGEDVMAAAPRLKLIQRPGAHVVGVDYDAAKRRGILISRFPSSVQGQPARDVAEHAFFLLLALVKQMRRAESVIRERRVGLPKTMRLHGKTLALIGIGATGAELARLARGFGIEVIAVKRTRDDALAKELDIRFLGTLDDLPQVLAQADFVSLHLPNNENTYKLIGVKEFAQMKPGAQFINISRANMVDREALVDALKSGRLGGAGLDVSWREPIDPEDPILKLDNVVVTPHIAGDTEEVEARLATLTAENIMRLRSGKKPNYVIGVDVDPL